MTTPSQGIISAADAQAKGLIPPGHVWDEDRQEPVERGLALMSDRLGKSVDLEANLAAFAANRTTLLKFVKQYLREAHYDARKLPIPGEMNDFYAVPGAKTKALTKLGAEKLGHLFRFGRSHTRIVASTETKEYVSATAECILTDQYRREIGSAVSACTTAETGFRSDAAKRKYGQDYRAALNDVTARAAKRAYVQAMIVATAADEIFTAAQGDEAGAGVMVDVTTKQAVDVTMTEVMPDGSDEDPTLTRDTPCPFANNQPLAALKPNQLRWLEGHVSGDQADEWLALIAKELAGRSK